MLEEQERISVVEGPPRWIGPAVVVLALVSLLALGLSWSAVSQATRTQEALAIQLVAEKKSTDLLGLRLDQTDESGAKVRGDLNVVMDRMKLTSNELAHARSQTKQIRAEYARKLGEMEQSVKGELATKASVDEVKAVSGDVGTVRTDLESTKQNLQMARGEMGTLIARNHDEIEQLRRLGERDYFEFTLERKGSRERVGNVTVELRGTNTKKHQFTLALYADDLRMEKKNRSVNEPIYFYTQGKRAAQELVVNQVGPNRISGYVSAQKGAVTAASGG